LGLILITISRNDLGLIWYGGPLAIIIKKKNVAEAKKINLMREFFATEFGIFKIDTEMQYSYGKQPIFVYNSHEIKLDKKTVKMIYRLYRKKKDKELLELLKKLYPVIGEAEDVYHAFNNIVEHCEHLPIDLDTEKYLPFFRARSPKGTKLVIEAGHRAKKDIVSLYPSLKAPLPLIAIMIGIVVFVIIMQDIPDWIRQLQEGLAKGLGSSISP